MHNACCSSVHAGASVFGIDSHAEQPELAASLKQRKIEFFLAIEFQSLRLHLGYRERSG